MFEKFQEAVRNAYLDLKKSNKLDFRRDRPSTGDLKNWCIQCLERGLTKEDETVFKNYFNATQSNKSLKDIIRDFEADKLRSLRNFIVNNGTRRPDWEVVKLLAILVDFKLRPYNRDDWDDKSIIKRPPLQPDSTDDGKQEEKQEENELDKTTTTFGGEGTTEEDSTKLDEETKVCEETVIYPEGQIKNEKELINPDNLVKDQKNVEAKTVLVADAIFTVIDSQTIDKDSPIIKDQGVYSNGDNGKVEETALSGDYSFRIKSFYGTSAEDNKLASTTDGSEGVDTTEVATPSPIKGKTFFRNKTYYPYGGLIMVIIAIVIYSFINKECMCWNGIKYIEVDCRDNTQPYQIIGLNEDKLHNFQKIMKPDTLTKADVGKVWYSKIDNEVEFFTHSGYHPVHIKKSLKAATEHIINTWAGRKSVNLDNKSIDALP
ncbi:hypothetical protein [Sphingobacterium faecium]|uniref:hypothetical protein n=1 Tax=Sphingobacterium faecium TaxID=34087 RepID=UPI003209BB61